MRTCEHCKREFPDHLINDMAQATPATGLKYRPVCPVCALAWMNQQGPTRTRFDGPRAQALLEEAQRHIANLT